MDAGSWSYTGSATKSITESFVDSVIIRTAPPAQSLTQTFTLSCAESFIKFGPNSMEVPSPSVAQLLVDELLHPFYMFQIIAKISKKSY